MVKTLSSKSTNDMTVGSPLRAIIKFAIPLILGYILQQMYLIMMPPSWEDGLAWELLRQ